MRICKQIVFYKGIAGALSLAMRTIVQYSMCFCFCLVAHKHTVQKTFYFAMAAFVSGVSQWMSCDEHVQSHRLQFTMRALKNFWNVLCGGMCRSIVPWLGLYCCEEYARDYAFDGNPPSLVHKYRQSHQDAQNNWSWSIKFEKCVHVNIWRRRKSRNCVSYMWNEMCDLNFE